MTSVALAQSRAEAQIASLLLHPSLVIRFPGTHHRSITITALSSAVRRTPKRGVVHPERPKACSASTSSSISSCTSGGGGGGFRPTGRGGGCEGEAARGQTSNDERGGGCHHLALLTMQTLHQHRWPNTRNPCHQRPAPSAPRSNHIRSYLIQFLIALLV